MYTLTCVLLTSLTDAHLALMNLVNREESDSMAWDSMTWASVFNDKNSSSKVNGALALEPSIAFISVENVPDKHVYKESASPMAKIHLIVDCEPFILMLVSVT